MDLLKKIDSDTIALLEIILCHNQCLFQVSHCFLQSASFFISFGFDSPTH